MINLGISNIAWGKSEDLEAYEIISANDFAIDIAPSRIWDDPFAQPVDKLQEFRKSLENIGLSVLGMQSLLFGHPDYKIFDNSRDKTMEMLKKCVDLGENIGAAALVFGSPKNRALPENSGRESIKIAEDFFREIGTYSASKDMRFCLEPNPKEYGTNFLTETEEALDFVRHLDITGLRINVDTGTMILNEEDPFTVLPENIEFIGHVHISEPFLEPIDPEKKIHRDLASILLDGKYSCNVSIEMKSGKDGADLERIDNAMQFVSEIYR